jgi:TRAP-type C4-dicarboxylate transport system permease small subunit
MRILEKISFFLLWIGMTALMVMVAFINVDIVLRYFFSKPIPGSTELVSMLLVIASFFCLALCQIHKRHITITIIPDMMRPGVRAYMDAVIALLSAAFTFFIIWQTYVQGISDYESNAITSIMRLRVAPFKFAAASATILLFLAFLSDFIQALSMIRGGSNSTKTETSSR